MRTPRMKIGNYIFKFIQVPYVDRYYIVELNEGSGYVQLAKIPVGTNKRTRIMDDWISLAVNRTDGGWSSTRTNQLETFWGNVEKKQKYLDATDS